MITARWNKLKYHPTQYEYWKCPSRFIVVPAGRRSGKTEIAKRKLLKEALHWHKTDDGKFVFAAPTHRQAKEIYWADIKAMVPKIALKTPKKPSRSISESTLSITLWNDAVVQVAGLDKPERIEGSPIDGICLDEYGNMKKSVWTEHIRPALSTIGRLGFAYLIGVPEGRNHYYSTVQMARAEMTRVGVSWEESWAYFHWHSSDILPKSEIEAAKRELDELTFQQEYEGSFVSFSGRVYYNFDHDIHAAQRLRYNPDLDLMFCFDFNVEPGVAAVIQEQDGVTAIIAEVYIPKNSNTVKVCNKLISMFPDHDKGVWCYGDATGGARGSAKVAGSDWDLVKVTLAPAFDPRNDGKLKFRVPKSNPPERTRVNSMNSRCLNALGESRLAVDPISCPKIIEDFDGVVALEGGSGEIDKSADKTKTHLTDAIGYYVWKRFPISGGRTSVDIL